MDRDIEEIKEIINNHPLPAEKVFLLDKADSTDLVQHMKNKKLTSVDILVYYLDRCIRIGVQLNAVIDFNHHEALEMAMMCD